MTNTEKLSGAADYSQEITNLIHFDLIDFVGWNNNDMDVMRTYHGDGVAVDMMGVHTDGIDPHVDALVQMLSGAFDKIVQHSPKLAQGDWTAVVGVTANGSMATVGQWKDGVLSAEYLFLRQLSAQEIAATDVSNAVATITTPDDKKLRAATGAEAGWSAVMGADYAIFTRTVDGSVAQQLGYASK